MKACASVLLVGAGSESCMDDESELPDRRDCSILKRCMFSR